MKCDVDDESDGCSDASETPESECNGSYFSSYENLDVHRLMLKDRPRTESYRQAIFENAKLFRDKLVMDVGCGTGILSLFAAEVGAAKVYAIEASRTALIARNVVRQNNLQHIIEVFSCPVEDFMLPNSQKVDVIISEWMGFYLLHESMLDSVILARNKFLKETGTIFPCTASIYACPSSLSDFYDEEVNFWDSVYGYDFSSVKMEVLQNKRQSPQIITVNSTDLVSNPCLIKQFDLMKVTLESLKEFECRFFVASLKDSICRGIILWFDCEFFSSTACEGNIVLSTSPQSQQTHWKQTAILLPTEISLENGDVIGFSVRMCQSLSNYRHYNIQVELLSDDEEHPVPCDCGLVKCKLIKAFVNEQEHLVDDYEVIEI
ncbi:protein arginine N-methyltransferase 1-like [Xenia sp. Carnegie-2017]|uniref:protein arginine N-methyltransferase 1-like n=1 Tax=Xenia sp. Carnegie-2017 TaxID=2897299 RepID=UPI001F04A230|nr:protein arginine N-methyltransferase 1-like [Xenia sp. Carnegie-2017]